MSKVKQTTRQSNTAHPRQSRTCTFMCKRSYLNSSLSLLPVCVQVFLRTGVLPKLDKSMEAHTHTSMVQFQARCRGYLGRQRFKHLELLDSAAYVIQSNVAVWMDIRDWSWWQLYTKVRMGA